MDAYPVTLVDPEWILEPEDMGTKRKFWFRKPAESGEDWLFKYPRPGTGEHWAEKIVAEVAHALGIEHATVELAELRGERGSCAKSFIHGDFELVHGNQVLEWTVAGYDSHRRFGQSDHSFVNIRDALQRIFVDKGASERHQTAFAGFLVLDALVGNTDRHHENWGILRRRDGDRWVGILAPTFDHASSLGRELLDERRMRTLRGGDVEQYSARGRGGVYWDMDTRYGPSPLELVRRARAERPDHFRPALERAANLRDARVREIVERVPAKWMSLAARGFAVALILTNRDRLLEMLS